MIETKKMLPFEERSQAFNIRVVIENKNYFVVVSPGTVNNIMPSNIITQKGILNKIPFTPKQLTYVKLACTSNSPGVVSSAVVVVDSKVPDVQNAVAFTTPTKFEILLGVVYDTQIYQIVTNNLFITSRVAYIENVPPTTPGQLPFKAFLVWGT